MMTPRGASTTTSLLAGPLPANCTSSTLSAQGGLPFLLRPCRMCGPWSVSRVPPTVRNCRPAYAVPWLLTSVQSLKLTLAPGWQARLSRPVPVPRPRAPSNPPRDAAPGEAARWWSHPGEHALLAACVGLECWCKNSQGGDPRTPDVTRGQSPTPNSQGRGPQDPKRPACPPFLGPRPVLSPLG